MISRNKSGFVMYSRQLLCLSMLVSASAFLSSGCAKTNKVYRVYKDCDGKIKPDIPGITYTLPKTIITVDLGIIRKKTITTPLYELTSNTLHKDYSDLFPQPLKGSIVCGIEKNPSIGMQAAPDLDSVFLVQFTGGLFHDRTLDMKLTRMGFMTSGQTIDTNRTVDFAIQTIKTAATIAGAATGAQGMAESTDTLTSEEEDAKKSCDEIRTLRSALRLSLADGGWRGTSTDAFERQIKEYDTRVEELFSNFRTIEVEKIILSFEITPTTNVISSKFKLFELADDGIISIDNNDQVRLLTPIPKDFTSTKTVDLKEVSINLAMDEQSQLIDRINNPIFKNDKPQGFFYRVPANVRIRLKKGDDLLALKTTQIAQWGKVLALPRKFKSRQIDEVIALTEDTGGLVQVSYKTQTFNPEGISQVGSSIAEVIKAEAQSEHDRLKREKEILEFKKAINELQEFE